MATTEDSSLSRITLRLSDIVALCEHQERLARRTRLYSWSLAASRYVIGLLLISTLFHNLFSVVWLAVFGVLLVATTALQMRYHPDVKFINAKTHLLKLQRVKTTVEHCRDALEAGYEKLTDVSAIEAQVDAVVDEVNRSQQLVYTFIRRPLLDRVLEPFRARRRGGRHPAAGGIESAGTVRHVPSHVSLDALAAGAPLNTDAPTLDDVEKRFNEVPAKVRRSRYFWSTKRYLGACNPDSEEWWRREIPWPDYTASSENELGLGEHVQGIQRIGKCVILSGGIATGVRRSQLIAIEMGSQNVSGPWSHPKYGFSYRRPSPQDRIVKVVDIDRDRWHAGGIQALGDVVAVPIYGKAAGSEIRYFDFRNPVAPVELEDARLERDDVKAKAVALIRLLDKRFVTMIWDDNHLDFHLSKSEALPEGFDTVPQRVAPSEVAGGFQPGGKGVSGRGTYQHVNFLRDTNNRVFFVGARNQQKGSPTFPGADFADLYEVSWPDGYERKPQITLLIHRQFYCYNQQANFGAGAGVYVDRPDRMYLYAASHWLHGGNARYNFNEYAAR